MYDRKLTVAEVRRRIDRYYVPYRAALREALDAAWRRHGAVWHFDLHSMKSRSNASNPDPRPTRPDFVIGDRDGTTAPPALTSWVADYFSRLGHSVSINHPYRGADLVRVHGDPANRRYSLQIEINRALYMDESTCTRRADFSCLREKLGQFAVAVREQVGALIRASA
jgi:N-formylglutamate deformylase